MSGKNTGYARGRRSRAVSRRRFMALVAAGAAAVVTAPARALTPPKKTTAPAPERPPEIEKGVAEQKTLLAQQLKTLRDYPLPPGSDPAFLFAPLKPRRGAR